MPWLEVNPMDAKVLFISDWLRRIFNFSELCDNHGVSRKTGYKWIARYREIGLEGLVDQQRRPHSSPERIPFVVRKEIILLRKTYKTWGPKKIGDLLGSMHPDWEIPSRTSIYNILKAEKLVSRRRRRRKVAPRTNRLTPGREPNDLWTVDFKGQFKTGDGTWCYPLTVMDDASRYLLGCTIFKGTYYEESRAAFERLFVEYGLPSRIRTDNGTPFASTSIGGLSQLAVWWIQAGIVPERISPGKPQQNSHHERMHLTMKNDAIRPPSRTLRHQQKRIDEFRHIYNEIRPHESLGMKSPQSVYRKSEREWKGQLGELEYPGYFQKVLVNHNGTIWLDGQNVYLGYLLRGQEVGMSEIEEGQWVVYFGPVLLGYLKKGASGEVQFQGTTVKV
jgi:putative transposase